jgi:hypothetical protein
MANHKNDHSHELTATVALRKEVGEALGTALPAKQKQEVVQRVEQIVERYSSPYPDPNYLAQIEQLAPGATRDIINASIEDLQHRRKMDERQLDLHEREMNLVQGIADAETRSVRQGRWIGFCAYLACLAFSGGMYVLGSEMLAIAGFSTAATGIIIQLIRGSTSSSVTVSAEKNSPERNKSVAKPG